MQYTTTGWIMYLASVGQLLLGARVILYDGSPFVPTPVTLLDIVESEKVTKLGISPRWMAEVAKMRDGGAEGERKNEVIKVKEKWDLSSLRIVTCTGMVLSEALFEWFYSDKGFPSHVCLANISGGTDIVSFFFRLQFFFFSLVLTISIANHNNPWNQAGCFALSNPMVPVHLGGTSGPSLGVSISLFPTTSASLSPKNSAAVSVPAGQPGELVATASFPNVPIYLWNDGPPSLPSRPPARQGSTFYKSYFARFPPSASHGAVWAHGDFCVVHPVTQGIFFLGRADGVLNPSGVRFGSAEIYGVLERNFGDRVVDSLCVGQKRLAGRDADERVLLFLLMKEGCEFSGELVRDVKVKIGEELSKRHVPAYVFETKGIPVSHLLFSFFFFPLNSLSFPYSVLMKKKKKTRPRSTSRK